MSPENSKLRLQTYGERTLKVIYWNSDENGVVNRDMPVSKGKSTFTKTAKGTRVEFKLIYSTVDQLQKIVEMGFEQGITMCMDQLDELFKKKFIK